MNSVRWLKLLFFTVLAFSILTGCSYGGGGEEASSESEAKDKSTVNADGKFDPPVQITTARPVGSDYTFINGEDIHNNVHNTWAKEKLGIEISDLWETADNGAYHTKIRLALTSSDQLPDVFVVQDANLIEDLIQSGKVKDIQSAFDEYASERIKKIYEDNSSVLNQVKKDNQLMGLPILSKGDGTNPVLWIRQDWLDNLGLDAPKTMEEFEMVMDAFTNQDPDGDGKDDTYGFTFSGRDGYANWMSDASFIFGAYTGKFLPGNWHEAEDGSLKYGSVQPGIKDALGKLNEWYSKDYLDKELAVLDPGKATEGFIQGNAGMIAAPHWADGWPLGDVIGTNPEAIVRAYPLPTGLDGKSARYSEAINEGKVMLFNADFEHMDAFFLYMDKIYDVEFETGEFKNGFFEGYDYAIVDGEPVYDPAKFPTPIEAVASSGKYNLFWNTPKIPFKESKDFDHVFNGNEIETNAHKLISSYPEERIRAGGLNYQMKNINAPNMFLGAPTETMRNRGENLSTMELETFSKIIYGNEPLDKFDSFVDDWYSKGGKEIEAEINEWYKQIK